MILIAIGLTLAFMVTQVLPGTVQMSDPPIAIAASESTSSSDAPLAPCGTEVPVVEPFIPEVVWTSTEGRDGARVEYPLLGWTWTEGSDGRRVALPLTGWTWTEGKDGRRVIMPLTGWTWTEGRDGRRVITPLTGWTWTEGADGRRVVYPLTGWTWEERQDGRRIVLPMSGQATHAHTGALLYEALEITPELAPYRHLLMAGMGLFDLD